MQRGSLIKKSRKWGPDVWLFRWSEKGTRGKRVYRKRVIGTHLRSIPTSTLLVAL
jgi:hypothetical protein